jgi:hypothetical protein
MGGSHRGTYARSGCKVAAGSIDDLGAEASGLIYLVAEFDPYWPVPVVEFATCEQRTCQAGTCASCSMSFRSFSSAQNSAGILTCIEL